MVRPNRQQAVDARRRTRWTPCTGYRAARDCPACRREASCHACRPARRIQAATRKKECWLLDASGRSAVTAIRHVCPRRPIVARLFHVPTWPSLRSSALMIAAGPEGYAYRLANAATLDDRRRGSEGVSTGRRPADCCRHRGLRSLACRRYLGQIHAGRRIGTRQCPMEPWRWYKFADWRCMLRA